MVDHVCLELIGPGLTSQLILSNSDTRFIWTLQISSSRIVGGLLLQPPSLQDYDQREMFSFYLYPGKRQNSEVHK